MSKRLWLYRWLDDHEVRSLKDAKRILKNDAPREELHELVSLSATDPLEISGSSAPTIVAGREIDLSGELACCFQWDLVQKQVDRLFSQVWHYFDRIVVVGPDASKISKMWRPESEPRVIELILTYIRLLLYLREIGAEDLLVFIQKPHVCEVHLDQDLKRLGMRPALEVADKTIEGLTGTAEIRTEPHEDHLHYTFNHPDFEHTVFGTVDKIFKGSHIALRQFVATDRGLQKIPSTLGFGYLDRQLLKIPLRCYGEASPTNARDVRGRLWRRRCSFSLTITISSWRCSKGSFED